MLDVADEMFGYRAGAGFRDDDAAAKLRRRHQHDCPDSHHDSYNSDSGPYLYAASINYGLLRAGDFLSGFSRLERRPVLRPRPVQLQRRQ